MPIITTHNGVGVYDKATVLQQVSFFVCRLPEPTNIANLQPVSP